MSVDSRFRMSQERLDELKKELEVSTVIDMQTQLEKKDALSTHKALFL